MFVEIIFGALRMSEIGRAKFTGFLSAHFGDKHSIVIYRHQRAVIFNKDIVGFEVAVCKGLFQKPIRKQSEPANKQIQTRLFVDMIFDIFIQSFALHPIHQKDGELGVVGAGINK
ncbi:MAG: hypothetical protein IKP73_18955 [Bacteroidales bacterium]|nr:hypothetical protein [Bacteroidales bacterium]